jgi:hypothetical protein
LNDVAPPKLRYSWWKFHLFLACGALYVASVITNWGYVQVETATYAVNSTLNVTVELGSSELHATAGNAPVWIQVLFAWATGLFYLVWAVPPILFPEREWGGAGLPSVSQV